MVQRCWFTYDLWSCPCSNAKRWETFCQHSTMQHWAFQSIIIIVSISIAKQAIFYIVCLRLIVDVCIYTKIIEFWIFVFSQLPSLIHWLSSSLLVYELFLYIYFFFSFIYLFFLQNYIIHTIHITILNFHYRHIYELYWEWLMQHISQTILKENKEVVNLILPKTSNNFCTFRNLVKSPHFKGSQFKL